MTFVFDRKDELNMTVKEFVEGYTQLGSEQLKEKYVKDNLTIEPYIPFQYKKELCEGIVSQAFFEFDDDVNIATKIPNNIKISLDSNVSYFLFNMILVDVYTNLEVGEYNYEEFDLLASSGLLEIIIQSIPESEINMFRFVNNNVINDFVTNNCSTKAYMEQLGLKLIVGLEGALNLFADSIESKIKDGSIDLSKIKDMITKEE